MTGTRDQLTIGRIMVLVAAVALVLAGVLELIGDGGQRVMLALGPGSPLTLHLAFALALILPGGWPAMYLARSGHRYRGPRFALPGRSVPFYRAVLRETRMPR